MIIRPDRDPLNKAAVMDLDDIDPNLKDWYYPVSKDDLLKEISQYNLSDVLIHIGHASAYLFVNVLHLSPDKLLTHWRISYLATLVLLTAKEETERKISETEFQNLMMMVNRYMNDNSGVMGESVSAEEWEIFSNRLMFFDNLFNKKIGQLVPRNHMIFKEIPLEKDFKPKFDMASKFKEITGVSFEHYSDIGMAISASFSRVTILGENYFKDIKPKELGEEVYKFLEFNSISVDEFRSKFTDEIFALTPFLNFPIIRLSQNRYVCPNVPALLIRSYELYHIFFTVMKRDFSDYYGRLLEDYVGKVLRITLGEKEVIIPEILYGSPSTQRTIDWFLKEGKTLILFECKNKRFHISKTITDGDVRQLNTDIEQSIAVAVSQLSTTIKAIKAQKFDVLKVFADVREFIPVVVLPELINHNSIGVRRRVAEILRKEGLEIDFYYHVIDIEELERILPFKDFSRGRLLRNFLNNKASNDKYKYRSFDTYVFHEYKKKIPYSFLKKRYWELAQVSVRRFFPNATLQREKQE